MNQKVEEYTDAQAVDDLSKVLAQFTSGIKGALPNVADRALARGILHETERQLKKN